MQLNEFGARGRHKAWTESSAVNGDRDRVRTCAWDGNKYPSMYVRGAWCCGGYLAGVCLEIAMLLESRIRSSTKALERGVGLSRLVVGNTSGRLQSRAPDFELRTKCRRKAMRSK